MIEIKKITKTYNTPKGPVTALNKVDLDIGGGEFVVFCGASGSGKTTLLMTVAAMLRPTSGNVKVDGTDLYSMSAGSRSQYRSRNVGFIFQMFHLVPYLNVCENILMGGLHRNPADRKRRATELIEELGLTGRSSHRPGELSAGEKQRTAIARAMLNDPRIILADEPTGNLDPENARVVLEYLSRFQQAGGTVLVATHGSRAESYADRVIHMDNGAVTNVA